MKPLQPMSFIVAIAILVFAGLLSACESKILTHSTTPPTPEAPAETAPSNVEQNLSVATDCATYQKAFELHLDSEAVNCSADFLEVAATGIPDLISEVSEDVPMVGIRSWIQRVLIPYDYQWRIPLSPTWLSEPTEASARGPIAVAVDGVPIFHYERRPDVSTSLDNHEQHNDTVTQGELDQCGGHAGQGEDYHYHYAPVCLMDKHSPDLPIAFCLERCTYLLR
ncbi:YHYH protein [Synechococcus sp. PCC 7335]|uniref:YHYH protein n=1 Tax=Synechococcus sp. (strain ATCC 29403 / PCC 7335) TaxID=91464 RepID=UPI000570A996|nr:YHYH protein [Synechococcus sp. PCC 7335]